MSPKPWTINLKPCFYYNGIGSTPYSKAVTLAAEADGVGVDDELAEIHSAGCRV
jgi:hypothetical protein